MAGRRTSIYLNPRLDKLAYDSGQKLGEALHRGLSVTPLLIEENERGGYTTHWFCEVPPEGAKFKVLRDQWRGTDKRPIREIYEIEVTQP